MKTALCLFALGAVATAQAAQFALPLPGTDLIGEPYEVTASAADTLLDIARRHGIGQEEILIANPRVDRWLPGAGTRITIPNQFILPDAPREGLVLNLPEMRLYHYLPKRPDTAPVIVTYPVSDGRMDWKTPLGAARIGRKQEKPSWRPPKSVIEEAIAAGQEPPPDVVPPGPDNPLGEYALRLNLPGYLIHGTNKPWGVGMRVTHGCVRLLPEHIEELFGRVDVGTRVHIVNQPVKLGWYGETLYLEVHPPLEEDQEARDGLLRFALEKIYAVLASHPRRLDGSAVRQAIEHPHGRPVPITSGTGQTLDNPVFR